MRHLFIGPYRKRRDRTEVWPRTQKARGFVTSSIHTGSGIIGVNNSPWDVLDAANPNIEINTYTYPIFARPCPMQPRHGFVDSRIVNNDQELLAVCVETAAADPMGEVLLVPYIDAAYNTVLTSSGLLTIGPGNAGATSGVDAITLFCAPTSNKFSDMSIYPLPSSYFHEDTDAFLEFVQDKYGTAVFTQLRPGPAMAKTVDYIPHQITVIEVLAAEGSLLDWETRMKTVPPGAVVCAYPGGSLTSHYGIHCVLNGVPFITSHNVSVGDVLEPIKQNTLDEFSIQTAIRDGVICGFKEGLTGTREDLERKSIMAVALLHNSAHTLLTGRYLDCQLLGWACAVLFRLACALLWGEARHFYKPFKQNPRREARSVRRKVAPIDRNLVYTTCLEKTFPFHEINAANHILDTSGISSYGGSRWRACGEATAQLYDKLYKTVNVKPAVKRLLETANTVLNCVHNTGKFLTKIINPLELDFAAQKPSLALVQVSDLLYTCAKTLSANNSDQQTPPPFKERKPADNRLYGPYSREARRTLNNIMKQAGLMTPENLTVVVTPSRITLSAPNTVPLDIHVHGPATHRIKNNVVGIFVNRVLTHTVVFNVTDTGS